MLCHPNSKKEIETMHLLQFPLAHVGLTSFSSLDLVTGSLVGCFVSFFFSFLFANYTFFRLCHFGSCLLGLAGKKVFYLYYFFLFFLFVPFAYYPFFFYISVFGCFDFFYDH